MIQALVKEIEKREALHELIDAIIDRLYIKNPKNRIKVGPNQDYILDIMGIQKNNLICTIITERMALKGYKKVLNSGNYYYKDVDLNPRPR